MLGDWTIVRFVTETLGEYGDSRGWTGFGGVGSCLYRQSQASMMRGKLVGYLVS